MEATDILYQGVVVRAERARRAWHNRRYGNHLAWTWHIFIPAPLGPSHPDGSVDRGQPGIPEGVPEGARGYDLHHARPLRPHTRCRTAGAAFFSGSGGYF